MRGAEPPAGPPPWRPPPPPPPAAPTGGGIGDEPAVAVDEARRRHRRKRSGPVRRMWRRSRRPLLWALAGAGVLLLLAAADAAIRYLPAARALAHGRDAAVQAEALLSSDLPHIDRARIQRASALLAEAREDFGPRSAIVEDGWMAGALDRLPLAGTQVKAVRALRDAGRAGAGLGVDLMPLLDEVIPDPSRATTPTLVRITEGVRDHQDSLTAASADLDALGRARAAIPGGTLLGPIDTARRTVERDAPRVEGAVGPALGLLQAVPAAVGQGRHSYLLLLENPTEERPSGGFIGAIGEVTFVDGVLAAASFEDPVVLNPKLAALRAPGPLDQHLFHGHPMELADSNWAADFPTAAAEVSRLYALATGRHTDGVISVDPVALSHVLAVRGPVTVPPYPQTITAANALVELDYIANGVRPSDPGKVFLPPFGRAMVDSVTKAPLSQLPALAAALQASAREKHIVLSFHDAGLQRLVDGGGFGGRILAPLSDALLVDDANLSGTKGDLTVTRHFELSARVDPDGQVHDHLVLTYHDPAPRDANIARLEIGSGGDYRDYLRVYVPETAQLDHLSLSLNGGRPATIAPERVEWEYQRESIAYWLIVPRGGSAQVTLDYSGPFADVSRSPERYGLLWQKQVNALTWPIDVSVELPGGVRRRWGSDLETDRGWQTTAG